MNQEELLTHLKKTVESHGAHSVQIFIDKHVSFESGLRTAQSDNIITLKFKRIKDEEIKEEE